MKNKKVVYFLLPATLVVWILIAVRIYHTLNPASEITDFAAKNVKQEIPDQAIADTFSIENNYRDPFGKTAIAVKSNNVSTSSITSIKEKPKPVIASQGDTWPVIIYSGMIKNQKSNKQLVLVSINGSLRTLRSGDISDNIQIGRIWKDSIEVVFGKKRKFVVK